MSRTGRPATRQIEAVRRAVTVVDALAEAGVELGTTEIARRTRISASTVSRLLSTLVDTGLVTHGAATERYRLGVHLVRLGNAAREAGDWRSRARPHIETIATLTGETITLSVPADREVVTVDFVQSPSSVRSVAEIGRPSISHATAAGKVFLAYGGSLPDTPLRRYTDRTLTDREAICADTERTRQRGWAEAVGEREPELNAIAAPVVDQAGSLRAILGVQGPASRFTPEAMRASVDTVLERAQLLSREL